MTLHVFGLPESPRWLAKRGREQEAIEVLCAVHDLEPTDPLILGEIEAIRAAIAIEQGAQEDFRPLQVRYPADTQTRYPRLVWSVHEPVVWDQPRGLLHADCPRTERAYASSTSNSDRRLRRAHVRRGQHSSRLPARQNGPQEDYGGRLWTAQRLYALYFSLVEL